MEGLFDNPLAGLDLGGLGMEGSSDNSNPTPQGVPDIPVGKSGEEEDSSTDDDLEINDGEDKARMSAALHQGIDLEPLEEEDSLGDASDDEGEVNIFQAFAGEGIISLGDDEEIPEDADLDWFAEKAKSKLQEDVNSAVEDYKDTLPEDIKYLLDNYEQGVPLHSLLSADKKIAEMSSITSEKIEGSEAMQKDLVSKYLKLSGENDEDIKETLLDYEDSGLLEKMAKRAHSKLLVHETKTKEAEIARSKEQEASRREQYNTWLSDLKTTIDSKDEILPGVELTAKQKKELYKGITQVDKNGKNAVARYRESNPDFDLQMAYLATVLKGDFSVLERIAETKATKDLKSKANSLSSSATKSGKKLKGVDINVMKKALKFK